MTRGLITRSDGKTTDLDKQDAENKPQLTKKMENYSSGQPKYIGEALPGTLTSEFKWRIRQMEYDNGENMPPTGETWASGTSEFIKEWDERNSYIYS